MQEIIVGIGFYLTIIITVLLMCCPYILLFCGTIWAIVATGRFLFK